jgi:chloride channel protein, CIC family
MANDAPIEPSTLAAQQAEADEHAPPTSLLRLCLLAMVVGIVTGIGAAVFRALIALVHNVMFLGQLSFAYDSSLFTPPSPWGPLVILVPVIGAVGVTFIVSNFAPEAKGHGVPEVMDAIYYGRGVIRPVVAVAKSLASALAIGTGAAVGREGPIIQIGAALGSSFGQVIRMAMGQRIVLVACGAGSGIAATFNTPIGGVLFAIELMLPEISVNTFLPVAIATGMATFIGRIFFGDRPAFDVPIDLAPLPPDAKSAAVLVLYVVLGAVVGVAAALFVKALHWTEELFEKIPGRYPRHMLGMLLVGILIYALMRWGGHYYVEGVGYATIQATLSSQLTGAWFFLLLYGCKLLATSLSLGSGSSGGIFSPALFMGATLGGAFAGLAYVAFPGLPISGAAFAMIGMGTMVGAGTGAAMTAIAMVFEMTRDYNIVLPMVLAVAVALGVRRLLSRENIYTMKLFQRGHPIPGAFYANMFLVRSAAAVMDRDFVLADADEDFDRVLHRLAGCHGCLRNVVVTRGEQIIGVLRVNADVPHEGGARVSMDALALPKFAIAPQRAAMFDVISRLSRCNALMVVVVDGDERPRRQNIVGVITKEAVADEVASSMRIYPI